VARSSMAGKGGRKYLSAEDIFGAEDIKTVEVEVPEWGGIVRLRMMSGEEAAQFSRMVEKDKGNANLKVLAMCAVNEAGDLLFTEEDVERLKKKSLAAIARLAKEAMRINGVSPGDAAEAKNG
jgi:hypothetical protein